MPDLFHIVLGCALIVVSAINARLQYARLGRRRGTRVRKVLSVPAGMPVRVALLSAALGAWNLTGGWAFTGVMLAIIAWEVAVWAAVLARRARRRAAQE